MAILSRSHRLVKPAVCECELLQAPIAPCEILNGRGAPGQLRINDTTYTVEILGYLPVEGEPVVDGYRLTKDNSEAHDLCLVAGRLECTCGDYEFRRAAQTDPKLFDCKHCTAIRQLFLLPEDQRPDVVIFRMTPGETRRINGHKVERFASGARIDGFAANTRNQIERLLRGEKPEPSSCVLEDL